MTDPNINMETGEVTTTRSPRFKQWAAFLVFSTVVLGSAVQVKNHSEPVTASNKYTVACAAVTFVITAVIVAMHCLPNAVTMLVGTQIEGIVVIVLIAFWTAIVAVNIDAGNNLGSKENGSDSVQNANLYYFSWLGWVTSIVLLVGFLRDAFGLDMMDEIRSRAARLQWWAALFACAFVVMGSAARVHHKDCLPTSNGGKSNIYCRKTKFAIAAGTLGVAFALLVIGTKVLKYTSGTAVTPFLLEVGISIFLLILSSFNVAYTTSADAPASAIGNLYYFSWLFFGISVLVGLECYGESISRPIGEEDNRDENGNHNNTGDLEVETFDDAI